MKNRTLEALTVLSVINKTSSEERFVDNLMDLEDLLEAKNTTNANIILEFLQWKYISRYSIITLQVNISHVAKFS